MIEIPDEDAPGDHSGSDVSSGESEVSDEASELSDSPRKRRKSRSKKSKAQKRQKKNAEAPDAANPAVEVLSIETTNHTVRRDRSKDVEHFFSPAYTLEGKKSRNCRKCRYVTTRASVWFYHANYCTTKYSESP